MSRNVLILGAGPAGLGLALQLLRRDDLDLSVTIVEQENYVGGLTAGFERDGVHFDFGSHRLHPNTDPRILQDIAQLLGDNLLTRPRNGRIKLLGKFIRFPLNPIDLIIHLPFRFVSGFVKDCLISPFRRKKRHHETFEQALLDGLGKTICNTFYFPYAKKIWGVPADQIDAEQAYKRVRANSFLKIIRKVLTSISGAKKANKNIFYYPLYGYHQIAASMADEVKRLGGKICLASRVEQVCIDTDGDLQITVDVSRKNNPQSTSKKSLEALNAHLVFSTIPVTELCRLIEPALPKRMQKNCEKISYRNMVLCYFLLETDKFTQFDAHYFPEEEYIFSRVSEPKNYADVTDPKGITGLCIEIPCGTGDAVWNASDEELMQHVLHDLDRAGLPITMPIKRFFTKRLHNVYPLYDVGFQAHLTKILDFLDTFPRLVTLGRQGLFAHDNTHHTIEVAYRASECVLADGTFDRGKWRGFRQQFQSHVVED